MNKIQVAPIKQTVSFDLFQNLDVRVGTIQAVDDVPRSDKYADGIAPVLAMPEKPVPNGVRAG